MAALLRAHTQGCRGYNANPAGRVTILTKLRKTGLHTLRRSVTVERMAHGSRRFGYKLKVGSLKRKLGPVAGTTQNLSYTRHMYI